MVDHGSLEELQPEVGFVTRDSELDSLMYVVEGEAEVVLKQWRTYNYSCRRIHWRAVLHNRRKTSADVKTGKDAAKIIRWNSEALRKYIAGQDSLKDHLDLIFTADLIHKLRDMEEDIDQIRHSQDLKIK